MLVLAHANRRRPGLDPVDMSASSRSGWGNGLATCYGYFGIVYYQQGLIPALHAARSADQIRPGETDILSTISQFAILVVTTSIWVLRGKRLVPLLRHLGPYIAILLLSLASVLWSDNPGVTLRRGTAQVTCVLFSVCLYRFFGLDRIIVMFARSTVALGLLSILVFLAAPSIGHEVDLGYEQAMRGVFPQKNVMAECMLVGLCCFAYRVVQEHRLRPSNLFGLATVGVCLLLAQSATSLGIAALVSIVAALMYLRERPNWYLLGLFAVAWLAIALVAVAILSPDTLFTLTGRDASLTGRVPLWDLILRKIAEQPLLGHGYAGFWNADSVSVQYLWLRSGWEAPGSHNGYLEVLLQLGIVGLLCYIWLWAGTIVRAVRASRRSGFAPSRWFLLFMLIQGLENLDEGPLSLPDHFTMLMVCASLTFSIWARNGQGSAH